ncbi:YfjI family protein [Chryseobacterium salipaludis]|uniref:DUF3987 domain-containing protein n=1 Tax=Chryseobacterium TaxID=59732 RepID=UPI001FF353D9|nr:MULTISPECIES: DUF3987 domain-containing protein [Chryseobacterium]MCJ8498556.1 YfjI family protein [Chryseobacterium salipaludis]MCX3297119.1 DUF3987 domain-containing protein [Planobacterium sp. JC490]
MRNKKAPHAEHEEPKLVKVQSKDTNFLQDLRQSIKDTANGTENAPPLHIFPAEVQQIIQEKHKQSLPIDFLFSSVLAAVSGAIGNALKVELIPGRPTNAALWLAVVADSGDGKTEGMETFLKPLIKLEAEAHRAYKEQQAAYDAAVSENNALPYSEREKIDQQPPERKRRVIQEFTAEAYANIMSRNKNGVIAFVDEIKGFVAGQGQYKGGKGNDRQFYLQVWNGSAAMIDRVTHSIFIENAFLSMLGGIQKEEAREVFGNMITDGFAPRFLYVLADKVPPGRWSLEPVDNSMMQRWDTIIRHINSLENTHVENNLITFEREAAEVMVSWRNNQERSNNYTTRLFDAKLQIYAIRFALILHTLRRATEGTFYHADKIDKQTAEDALALAAYFRKNALKFIQRLNLDDPLEGLEGVKLDLYSRLPEEFTTAEGAAISKENNLLQHTAFSTFLKNKRLFAKVSKGVYRKILSDDEDE